MMLLHPFECRFLAVTLDLWLNFKMSLTRLKLLNHLDALMINHVIRWPPNLENKHSWWEVTTSPSSSLSHGPCAKQNPGIKGNHRREETIGKSRKENQIIKKKNPQMKLHWMGRQWTLWLSEKKNHISYEYWRDSQVFHNKCKVH